jgi:translation initiation factor 2 subunit 1
MHQQKSGFPNEGEIVACTVKKILKTTVFVKLDEYEQEGIIHISEISPGRIRTINEFVKENKKIICKVLRKNERYGNLDLSLRRVTTGQKLNKLREDKLKDKCIKIIESISKQLKLDIEKTYSIINEKIKGKYESISEAFQTVAEELDKSPLKDIGIDKKLAEALEETIKIRLKPKEIKELKNLEVIKKSLEMASKFAKEKDYNLTLTYVSAPNYQLSVTSPNPKEIESQSEEIIEVIKKELKKGGGDLKVQKIKK